MLSGKTLRDHQCDIKAVGDIASELSDPSARPEGYGSLHRVPEKATHMTRQFIEMTTKATIQELLKVTIDLRQIWDKNANLIFIHKIKARFYVRSHTFWLLEPNTSYSESSSVWCQICGLRW